MALQNTDGDLTLRPATVDDLGLLTTLNQQLIEDQEYDSRASRDGLEQRMLHWISGKYRVGIFDIDGTAAAYSVWREDEEELYVRHFFVARDHRRSHVGRRAFSLLERIAKHRPVKLDVLLHNTRALAFYRAIGFTDYSLVLRRRLPDHSTT